MESVKYQTKSGATQFRPAMTEDEYSELNRDGGVGFCLGCGSQADGVEPDARRYECQSCGASKVYGMEELLMMGLLTFADSKAVA